MIEEALRQITIRHDFFSYAMIIGIFQGLLSSIIIYRKRKNNRELNILLLALVFSVSLILLDQFLGYTGLMKYALHLNNFSESLVLLIIPLIYLIISYLLNREPIGLKTHYVHFIFPIVYFIYQWFYFLQPIEVKLNGVIEAYYFGEIDLVAVDPLFNEDPLSIRYHRRWIILVGVIYAILIIKVIWSAAKSGRLHLLGINAKSKIRFARNMAITVLIFFTTVLIIYVNYDADLGDHYIALFISYCLIALGFFISSESRFFENAWLADKYETSGLARDQRDILEKVKSYFAKEKFYLQKDATLKNLAKELNIPTNYISQSVNNQLKIGFNDFINQYRIEEVKGRLMSEEFKHLNIEGIGNSVGFKSKSAFYGAFKKVVGMTPNQWIKDI